MTSRGDDRPRRAARERVDSRIRLYTLTTPYHYSIVRCRDAAVRGEHRNVGLLVVSPAERKAWLRRGRLDARAHLVGDDAAFMRALLDVLQDEAEDIAREGEASRVHDWMRRTSSAKASAFTEAFARARA